MKSHLFQLLLFLLLLVDTTHSSVNLRAVTSIIKGIYKISYRPIKDELKNYAWNKAVDEVQNQLLGPPTPYNSPPQPAYDSPRQLPYGSPIQSLSQIKEYFYNFGYLRKTGQFDDSWDEETVSAIKTYQQKFNLDVSGSLTEDTLRQIRLPRCGVPDINFSYDGTDPSWPKAGNQWFRNTKTLTYGFQRDCEIPKNMTKVFRDAFMRWSQSPATSVKNFTETGYDFADIKIGFYYFDTSTVQDTVVGESIITLQQFGEDNSGKMYLDGTKYWVLPNATFSWRWDYGQMDLETVVMHQIGHLLGYDHSFVKDSYMYPIMPTQSRKGLTPNSDNDHNPYVHNPYVDSGYAAAGCFALFGSGSGLLTILSLGFAFMDLLD